MLVFCPCQQHFVLLDKYLLRKDNKRDIIEEREVMNILGDIIKNRRLELGLTLEQVGNAVGVGKSTVRKWETGNIQNMRRDKIALLADVLIMSPAELIDIDGPEFGQNDLTPSEKRLVQAYRAADPVYRDVALKMLEDNPARKAGEKMA